MTKRVGIILAALAVAAVVWFAVVVGRFMYAVEHPEVATHMPSHPRVPDGASDVSYSVSPLHQIFVFKVSEAEFTAWATRKGYHHRGYKQSDGSYKDYEHGLTHSAAAGAANSLSVRIPGMTSEVEITNGIWIINRDVDGGGYTIAYDRSTGYGYLKWSAN